MKRLHSVNSDYIKRHTNYFCILNQSRHNSTKYPFVGRGSATSCALVFVCP